MLKTCSIDLFQVSISSTFYIRIFCANNISAAFLYYMYVKKLPKQHSYEKFVHKMLMKLTHSSWCCFFSFELSLKVIIR